MNTDISKHERDELNKAISSADDYQDNTEYLRNTRFSDRIRDDVDTMARLRNTIDASIFVESAKRECSFLYTNYPDIFKRLAEDKLDMAIMRQMLAVLKKIEMGEIEQQEGSLIVGRILKGLFVDPTIAPPPPATSSSAAAVPELSWKEYATSHYIKYKGSV